MDGLLSGRSCACLRLAWVPSLPLPPLALQSTLLKTKTAVFSRALPLRSARPNPPTDGVREQSMSNRGPSIYIASFSHLLSQPPLVLMFPPLCWCWCESIVSVFHSLEQCTRSSGSALPLSPLPHRMHPLKDINILSVRGVTWKAYFFRSYHVWNSKFFLLWPFCSPKTLWGIVIV